MRWEPAERRLMWLQSQDHKARPKMSPDDRSGRPTCRWGWLRRALHCRSPLMAPGKRRETTNWTRRRSTGGRPKNSPQPEDGCGRRLILVPRCERRRTITARDSDSEVRTRVEESGDDEWMDGCDDLCQLARSLALFIRRWPRSARRENLINHNFQAPPLRSPHPPRQLICSRRRFCSTWGRRTALGSRGQSGEQQPDTSSVTWDRGKGPRTSYVTLESKRMKQPPFSTRTPALRSQSRVYPSQRGA